MTENQTVKIEALSSRMKTPVYDVIILHAQ